MKQRATRLLLLVRLLGPVDAEYTLRAHLLVYGLGITLPLLVLLGILLVREHTLERAQTEHRLSQIAGDLTNDIDRDIDRRLAILRTLATSPLLAAENWPAFYEQAKAAAEGDSYIILVDTAGRQIVNTYVPYGAAPAVTGDPETVRRISETDAPAVSNLFMSFVVKEPVFNISIPVRRRGATAYVLSLGLLPKDLMQIIAGQSLEPEWITSVIDGNDVVLARRHGQGQYLGAKLPVHLTRTALRPDRVASAADLDGKDALIATSASHLSDWRLMVSVPVTVIEAPLRRSAWLWSSIALAASLVTVLAGLRLARRIGAPIAALSEAAASLGRGESVTLVPSPLKEANTLSSALLATHNELSRATENLRRSELRARADAAKLKAILDHAPAAIGIAEDPDCRVIYGNKTAETWWGVPSGSNLTLTSGSGAPAIAIYRDGRAVTPDELPMQRAGKSGQAVSDELDIHFPDGRVLSVMGTAAPLTDVAGHVSGVVGVFVDISARKLAEEQQTTLVRELNHRVKNTLAIVQAIAAQTLRTTPDTREFVERFSTRLAALSRVHSLLTERAWKDGSLEEIVRSVLAPFSNNQRRTTIVRSSDLSLPVNTAVTLSLLLHELATNAVKYGSLSVAGGSLRVQWRTADGKVHFEWREQDGPPVAAKPSHEGFGSQLIALSAAQLNGTVQMDYCPSGLHASLSFPLPT